MPATITTMREKHDKLQFVHFSCWQAKSSGGQIRYVWLLQTKWLKVLFLCARVCASMYAEELNYFLCRLFEVNTLPKQFWGGKCSYWWSWELLTAHFLQSEAMRVKCLFFYHYCIWAKLLQVMNNFLLGLIQYLLVYESRDQISLYQWSSTVVHGQKTSKGGPNKSLNYLL